MVVSDNGASPEGGPTGTTNELQFFNNAPEPLEDSVRAMADLGGPTTFNHYPWGWTWAGNTPFRRWKRETYRGGACDPFLVSWPAGIKARGEIRDQYAHIIDMVPTVLDVLGVDPPATVRGVTQAPIHGVSFAHTFDDPAAPTRHRTQYFEMFGTVTRRLSGFWIRRAWASTVVAHRSASCTATLWVFSVRRKRSFTWTPWTVPRRAATGRTGHR